MQGHGRKTTGIRAAAGAALLAPLSAHPAFAATDTLFSDLSPAQVVTLVAVVGTVFFAVFSVVALYRARFRAESENATLSAEVGKLKAALDRAEALVDEEDQRLVAWSVPGEWPLIAGSLPAATGAPAGRSEFLAFGMWLAAELGQPA